MLTTRKLCNKFKNLINIHTYINIYLEENVVYSKKQKENEV